MLLPCRRTVDGTEGPTDTSTDCIKFNWHRYRARGTRSQAFADFVARFPAQFVIAR